MSDYAPFECLLPDIIPMVPGCPDMTIISNIRSATIEFCEQSEAYNVLLPHIARIAGVSEYNLRPPKCMTVHKIMQMAYDGVDIDPTSNLLLDQRMPHWRTQAGIPKYFVKQNGDRVVIAPVSAGTEPMAVLCRAVLKPMHNAHSVETWFMNDYREAIINGALFRLLRIPSKAWQDTRAAGVYGQLFAGGIADAKLRSRQADTRVARKTRYAGSKSTDVRFSTRYGR
jgi:hypothetical protein